jgi:tRNA (cytidine/uridine-2'-O-)-methyltransferase
MVNIILFQPEKPANVGNIIRACQNFHANLIIITPITFSMAEKDLKRAGLDYIQNVNITTIDYSTFLQNYDLNNIFYITRYGKKTPDVFNFSNTNQDYYVMFGRESTGIPKDLLAKNLDKCVRIPMLKDSRSINLSNAVAIMLYEISRQQDYHQLSKTETIKGEDYLLNFLEND